MLLHHIPFGVRNDHYAEHVRSSGPPLCFSAQCGTTNRTRRPRATVPDDGGRLHRSSGGLLICGILENTMITGGNATVYVSDMDLAVSFYVNVLGLKLKQRFGSHWAEIKVGENLVIGLHPKSEKVPAPGTSGAISIGLMIDEPIDEVVQRLGAKGVSFRGPVVRDEKAGIAFASFGDQDGNDLYLCQMTSSR